MGQSVARPKSSYSATARNRNRERLLEDERIEMALSACNNKLYNATCNLENKRQ